MILVDSRIGSKEVLPCFAPYDVPAELAELEFADFMFIGNGPEGLASIGMERKVLSDMVKSMRDKRLQGYQLKGLFDTFTMVYLIIEGRWRCGSSGAIEVWKWDVKLRKMTWQTYYAGNRPILYRELSHFISTLANKYGWKFRYERTEDKDQTAAFVVSEYKWWNDKEWHQHTSDEAIYSGKYDPQQQTSTSRVGYSNRTVSQLEIWMAGIKGVDRAAYPIARAYGSMEKLMLASVEELSEIRVEQMAKGGKKLVRLGDSAAGKVWRSIRGL